MPAGEGTENSTSGYLFVTGFTSTSVQILLLRELLNISGGFEIATGIYFAVWLFSSAAGANHGRKSRGLKTKLLAPLFAISPAISIAGMLVFTKLLLDTGESPSLLSILLISIAALAPFCYLSGYFFINLVSSTVIRKGILPGRSYAIETAGGIIAGIIITIVTGGLLTNYKLLAIITACTIAFVICWKIRGKAVYRITGTLIGISVLIFILSKGDYDLLPARLLFPGMVIEKMHDSPYGNIVVASGSGERNVFYNHRLVNSGENVIEAEENIHYPMMQTDNPEKVLIVGGSPASHLPELMKYGLKEIIYIERDPVLLSLYEDSLIRNNTKIRFENTDAYQFIRNTGESFDAVILIVPPPYTLSLNRFYTKEFYSEVHRILTYDGVFACSPGAMENYFSPEHIKAYSAIYMSLKSVFGNVAPYPGEKLYFIASAGNISLEPVEKINEKGISTSYVNGSYFSDDLFLARSNQVSAQLDRNSRINRAISPSACFHYQALRASMDISENSLLYIPGILAFVSLFIIYKQQNRILFSVAASLSGFEIITLFMIQVCAGNIYQVTALLISVMMAGLAAGAAISTGTNRNSVRNASLLLACFFIISGLISGELLRIRNNNLTIIILSAMLFIPGLVTGRLFRIVTLKDTDGSKSSSAYAADLAGSGSGFILASLLAVPLAGIRMSSFMLAGIVIAGLFFGTDRNKY